MGVIEEEELVAPEIGPEEIPVPEDVIPGESTGRDEEVPGEAVTPIEGEFGLRSAPVNRDYDFDSRDTSTTMVPRSVVPNDEFADDSGEVLLMPKSSAKPLPIRPITFQQDSVEATRVDANSPKRIGVSLPDPVMIPAQDQETTTANPVKPVARNVPGSVTSIDYASGRVSLKVKQSSDLEPGRAAQVYRTYLIGERQVAELILVESHQDHVIARVTDPQMLPWITVGDRAVVR
jgi:hypothetical protein